MDFSVDWNGSSPGGNVTFKGETPWDYTGTWRMPALEELALLRTALPLTWSEGNPLGKDSQAVTVYVPPGDWIDPWRTESITGAAILPCPTPLDEIPVYVRATATSLLPLFMDDQPAAT